MGLYVLYFGTHAHDIPTSPITPSGWGRAIAICCTTFSRSAFSRTIFRSTSTARRRPIRVSRRPAATVSMCWRRCPNTLGQQDWAIEAPKLQARIVDALDRTMLPGLKQTITADFVMTPGRFRGPLSQLRRRRASRSRRTSRSPPGSASTTRRRASKISTLSARARIRVPACRACCARQKCSTG